VVAVVVEEVVPNDFALVDIRLAQDALVVHASDAGDAE
jgi:hypothetical protein